jgi:two-component SAPR family response regulator
MQPTTSSAVAVRLLGGFSMDVAGQPVGPWRGGKARGLFQYLLLNRGRLVVRERLNEVLWPGTDRNRGGSSLKVAAHALREVLARVPEDAGLVLVYQDHGYLLRAERVWTDVDEFERCCAVGVDGADRTAMRLYRGDFLGTDASPWAIEQREWYRSLALRVLDRLRDDALRRGDDIELVTWCRRSLEIDPSREATYQALMAAHARFGELDRVHSWYRICLRRLRDDFGVEPTPETHRVFVEALRRGEVPRGAPAGARGRGPAVSRGAAGAAGAAGGSRPASLPRPAAH